MSEREFATDRRSRETAERWNKPGTTKDRPKPEDRTGKKGSTPSEDGTKDSRDAREQSGQ